MRKRNSFFKYFQNCQSSFRCLLEHYVLRILNTEILSFVSILSIEDIEYWDICLTIEHWGNWILRYLFEYRALRISNIKIFVWLCIVIFVYTYPVEPSIVFYIIIYYVCWMAYMCMYIGLCLHVIGMFVKENNYILIYTRLYYFKGN